MLIPILNIFPFNCFALCVTFFNDLIARIRRDYKNNYSILVAPGPNEFDEAKTLNGIKNVKKNTNLIGRWQTIKNNPKIIFDIAHNVNSLELIFIKV